MKGRILFSVVLRRMFLASSAGKLSSLLTLEHMSVLVFQFCNLPAIGSFLHFTIVPARQCAGKSDYRNGINL